MENFVNTRLFRNASVLVWINSLGLSINNMYQCISMIIENAHESFSLKFEIDVRV